MEDQLINSKLKKLEKNFLKYKISFYVLFGISMIGFLTLAYFIFSYSYGIYEEAPKVTYGSNLTLNQLSQIDEMMSDLKFLYYHSAKSYFFTGIQEEVNGNNWTIGNNFMGYIRIYLTDDLEYNREVLCHEISHSFLRGEKRFSVIGKEYNNISLSLEEDYAYDLMVTKFCFEENTYSRCSNKEDTYYSYYADCQFFDGGY